MFKYIVGSFILISSAVFACENQEAQFIGKVSNYTQLQLSESTIECYFNIQLSMLNSSQVCPLVEGEVVGYQFQDKDCSLKNGDPISGVLRRVGNWIVVE
ncbi:MAG: hypothetical protein H7256_03385 [Bdellovibrio sp.]|nr:hypothetical protein [Bdellovibrio sp.]